MHEVICVGGSVAGAATAAFLARGGRRVLVLDKARFPRDKACGEGILPHGVEVLQRLGVPLAGAQVIRGIRYSLGEDGATVLFPRGHGLAMRRRLLDAELIRHAERCGAEVKTAVVRSISPGRVVTDCGAFDARILVGADGANSIFHRALGLRVSGPRPRVGFSTHLEGFETERDLVDVVFFDGGEVYSAPVDGGLTLVSFLVERSFPLRPEGILDALRKLMPDRVKGAALAGPVLASAPLARTVDRIAGDGWLLVGDSAGCIDPITGEGISVALVCAEMAAKAIEGRLQGREEAPVYARRAEKFRRSVERLTNLVLWASRHPWVARRFLRAGARMERLMRVGIGMESFSLPRIVLGALR